MSDQLDVKPDPAWDYYVTWHSLIHVQGKINEVLQFMKDIESADTESDKSLSEDLNQIVDLIQDIVEALTPDEPD